RVFLVIGDFELGSAGGLQAVNEAGDGAVPFAFEPDFDAVAINGALANDRAAAGFLRAEFTEFPGRVALDIFAPEHLLQIRGADFAAQAVHFVIGNRAEFALHFLGQFDAEFALQKIRDAALAGLAVDPDHLAVFAIDVRGINRQIGHIPMRTAVVVPLGQAFPNGVLMRAAESGENQFPGIRLTRRNGHARATLINFANGIDVRKSQLRVNAMRIEIERNGDNVQI